MACLLLVSAVSASSADKYFRYGATNIPHDDKIDKGGEDAWLAQSDLLIVADGVGGWADQGVDPGLFSKQLVVDLEALHDFHLHQEPGKRETIKQELKDAVEVGVQQNMGTCTVVIVKFDDLNPSRLKAINLGDSGYLLLRPDGNGKEGKLKRIFRTKEQQHSFNFPFQVGTHGDDPMKADDLSHDIEDNDIIVVASDGVFDNLYDKDLAECVKLSMDQFTLTDPQEVSKCIGDKAYKYGKMSNYLSPFAKNAHAMSVSYPNRGKEDDVTVVVAQIHSFGDGPDGKHRSQKTSTNGAELNFIVKYQ